MVKGSINNAFVLIENLWRARDGVEVCMYSVRFTSGAVCSFQSHPSPGHF